MADLPILMVLPDLLTALDTGRNAVLVAPPGAGKTTAVAPALLDRSWCAGRVLLLGPRRLAVRAAAERIAALAGEPVGQRIGYASRLDSRQSAATCLLAITQGIFVQMIQADPELAGISAVLFDEVHERSLEGDFGLALALDAQGALRPDLRIVAMSATLEGPRFSALLGGAPVIESAGRSHPIEHVHLGRGAGRIEDDVAAAVRRALGETTGGILAFLPGVAEIARTAERLEPLPAGCTLHRLHGQADPASQRAAIAPEPPGRRKIVLATSIAETSVTIDGLAVVIDSGLARRPRYDRGAGMTRLATERVSQAAATQRAGRAGRQAPGIAYRLWERAATAGLAPFDPPEIAEADLSALVLACALWGVTEPATLRWIDPPTPAALDEARRRLRAFGLIDGDGRATEHGRRVARLPLAPRLGHMLVAAATRGYGGTAAHVAVLLSEHALGGNDADLEMRLRRWHGERGPRADAARALAARWARGVGATAVAEIEAIGACVALAYPDRIAKRRGADGAEWIAAGGRGFRLDPASPLASSEWLAVAETGGAAAAARILSAAPLDPATIEDLCADRIETVRAMVFDPATGAVAATRERRLGAIRLTRGPDAGADPAAIADALAEGVRAHGLATMPWDAAVERLRRRAAFVLADDPLSDAALRARLDDWLPPLVAGCRSLSDIAPGALADALEGLLDWEELRRLDSIAPPDFRSPAGSRHPIDYGAEGGPTVELRVQALFGLAAHPMIGTVPLVLRLTSPAGRPIQTTRDLPGFWAGSWTQVAREMRGRYPRHPGRKTPPPPRRRSGPSAPLDGRRGRDRATAMTHARIRQRAKSSMQSGRANEGSWLLEYEPAEAKRPDPLTGWAGSGDTREQVRLPFPTMDAAKAYAERHGLAYHVVPGGAARTLKLQTYAENFKGPDLN